MVAHTTPLQQFIALRPSGGFRLIMADPPWSFDNFSEAGEEKNAKAHYACTPLDWIKSLPVSTLAAENCVLWLWATNPMLPEALEVMRDWGFDYKTAGHWSKKTKHGKQAFGTGYILRCAGEPFLIGTRGNPKTTHVVLPFLIALWAGQRQGDILALTWSAYDGRALRLRQSKTGATLTVPCAAPLRTALDAAKNKAESAPTICTTSRGDPWTSNGYRASFNKALARAGISDRTFHDLRGTAVTRLAIAGASVPEIASITGHSLKDVEAMLDRHYLSRDRALGESAIAKLEAHGTKPKL